MSQLNFLESIPCEHDTCRQRKYPAMADYICLDHTYCRKHIGSFMRFAVLFGLARAPVVRNLHPREDETIMEDVAEQINTGAMGPNVKAEYHRAA